jgi:hypothetical protein
LGLESDWIYLAGAEASDSSNKQSKDDESEFMSAIELLSKLKVGDSVEVTCGYQNEDCKQNVFAITRRGL